MVLALAATMLLATASLAMAAPSDNAECAEAGAVNHGAHILDYGPSTGGVAFGTPAHFGDHGAGPGATFCQGDNSAPSLLGEPGRFA